MTHSSRGCTVETFSCELVRRQGIVLGARRRSRPLHGGQKVTKEKKVWCGSHAPIMQLTGKLKEIDYNFEIAWAT